jgi:hypothetical protein
MEGVALVCDWLRHEVYFWAYSGRVGRELFPHTRTGAHALTHSDYAGYTWRRDLVNSTGMLAHHSGRAV